VTVWVKICGLREPAGWDAAVEAGADWLGLVFFRRSPRFITITEAARLAARGTGSAGLVGLFVAPFSEDEVRAVLDAVPLTALQVYGDAPTSSEQFGVPVWRAFGISARGDLPRTSLGAERLVIEANPPAGATRPGGNAARFDWNVLHGWQAPAPWTLGGGLSAGNIGEAVRVTGAQAVDVSSGVEAAPGVKDPRLVRAFIQAARSAGV
jgi:phosphoribosylanthranilate isomerase